MQVPAGHVFPDAPAPAGDRNPVIDALRAACILYIVGYWHLLNYTTAFRAYSHPPAALVTVAILGLFLLVSGFLVGGKRITAAEFYRSRLLRIYPPYLAAVLVYLAMDLSRPQILAKTATLVTMFSIPAPPTLWFIATIIYYYLATPLLRNASDNAWRYLLICGCLVLPPCIYGRVTGLMDWRIVMYFPVFATGVFLGRNRHLLAKWRGSALGALAALSVAICFTHDLTLVEESLWSIPLAVFVPLLVFVFAMRHRPASRRRWVEIVSYASYFMYLFHRPIFEAIRRSLLPATPWAQVLFLVVVCLPLCVAVSWAAQAAYDRLVARWVRPPGRIT